MDIRVTYGTGEGFTKSSAFDRALFNAGIANYNLIKVSSVIPEKSRVLIKKINCNQKEHGYKLYVALAKHTETIIGKEAWAGLGWIQNKRGKGLFVEHSGSSKKQVGDLINDSLNNMKEYRHEEYFSYWWRGISGLLHMREAS